MDLERFRELIERLGLTQTSAAAFLGIDERTARRFAQRGDIPRAIELLLEIMIAYGISASDAETILERRRHEDDSAG